MAPRDPEAQRSRIQPAVAACCPTGGEHVVICHLGGFTEADLGSVERLARMHLNVRRLGLVALFCHAPPALVALLELVGLGDVLQVASVVEPRREPEQREEPLRAEKRVHRRDLPGGDLDDLQ